MELATSLSKMDVEVYIFSPFEISRSISERIHVRHVSTFTSKLGLSNAAYSLFRSTFNNVFFSRNFALKESVLNMSINSLAKDLYHAVKNIRLDVIQGEQEIASLASLRISKRLRIPVIADLHNIWAEEIVESEIINRTDQQFKTLQKLENEIVNTADIVAVVSEEMRQYVKDKYGAYGSRIVIVPNGGRLRMQKAKYHDNPSKVVYTGMLAYREHVDLYIRSMPKVAEMHPSTRFYLAGKGEDEKKIRRLAKNLGVKPKFAWFHPINEKEEFMNFLSTCHVGALPSTSDIARRMGYPIKLFDYLSVGLPVVANDIGAWTRIIGKRKVGILTEDSPQSFAEGILELLKNPELLYACSRRGIDLIKAEFNWDLSAKILREKYNQL